MRGSEVLPARFRVKLGLDGGIDDKLRLTGFATNAAPGLGVYVDEPARGRAVSLAPVVMWKRCTAPATVRCVKSPDMDPGHGLGISRMTSALLMVAKHGRSEVAAMGNVTRM